jgi:hypothetical protein
VKLNDVAKVKYLAISVAFLLISSLSSCKEKVQSEMNSSAEVGNSSSEISLEKKSVSGCWGGELRIATVPNTGAGFEPFVVKTSPLKGRQAFQQLATQNIHPELLVNASFFNEKTGVSTTYFKGTALIEKFGKTEHTEAVYFPERSCFSYSKNKFPKIMFANFLSPQKELLKTYDEVFCAGPKAVQNSKNVVNQTSCSEKFSANCRTDGQDPISVSASQARAASCLLASNQNSQTIKFFHVSTSLWNCGYSLSALADKMQQEGCQEGFFHDGGNSASLVVKTNKGIEFFASPGILERPVPIWLGIIRR